MKRFLIYALAFAGALALRLWYLHNFRQSPFFGTPIFDETEYLDWAKNILAGNFLQKEISYHGPLYAFFLAGVQRLFGESLYAIRAFQAVLGGLTVVLCGAAAGRLWGGAARVAALVLCALCGPFILFSGQIMPATLAIFLNALGLYLMIRSIDRPAIHLWLAAGFAFSASAVARPNILPFAVLGAAWIWRLVRTRNESDSEEARYDYGLFLRRPAVHAAAFLIGFVLMMVPSATLNKLTSGEWLILQRGGGANFYVGNGPGTDGLTIVPGARWRELQNLPLREGALTARRQDGFYWRATFKHIASRPGAFLKNMARKAAFTLSAGETGSIHELSYLRKVGRLPQFPGLGYGALFILGAGGLAWLLSSGKGAEKSGPNKGSAQTFEARPKCIAWLLLLYWLTYFAGCVLFVASERYRLPSALAWILLSAGPFAALTKPGRLGGAASRIAAGISVGAALSLAPLAAGIGGPRNLQEYRLGILERSKGNYAEALDHFAALKKVPDLEAIRLFAQGMTYREFQVSVSKQANASFEERKKAAEDLLEQAKSAFEELIRLKPDFEDALHQLALIEFEKGEYDEALRLTEKTLEVDAYYMPALIAKGNILAAAGNPGMGLAAFQDALAVDPDDPLVHLNLGKLQFDTGDMANALQSFRKAAQLDPSSAEAWYHLGLVVQYQAQHLGLPDMLDLATKNYKKALDLGGDESRIRTNMGAILLSQKDLQSAAAEFTRALQLNPENITALMDMGNLHKAAGRAALAEEHYQKILQIRPDNLDARHGVGMALQMDGQYAEAQNIFEGILKEHPDHAKSHASMATLGLIYRQFDCEEGLKHLREAARLQPDNGLFKNNLNTIEDALAGLKRENKTCADVKNFEELLGYSNWEEKYRIKK